MPSVPSRIDGPLAVIGDVHGQTEKLRRIIGQLARVPQVDRRWIVFVGDLVDRGPDPAGTIQLFCDLVAQHQKVTWACGNHELAMAASLGLIQVSDFVDFSARWVNHYLSESTFESYGVEHGNLQGLREALPKSHANVLSDLPWIIEHPDYVVVHAGLDRNLPFETQLRILRERDYTLSHPPWLYSRDFILQGPPDDCPVPVVVGHVPIPSVRIENGMVAIDTGSGHDGPLSCVLLPENEILMSDPVTMQPETPQESGGPRRAWWRPW